MKDQELFNFLTSNNIEYQFFEHPALVGMEDSYKYTNHIPGEHCKNLFLCDKKKENFYHVITFGKKIIDLKLLQEIFQSSRLSFVSAERLYDMLGLTPGCVNPLNMYKTKENIHYYFDEELIKCEALIFCPNTNDESISISIGEFLRFIKLSKNTVKFIKM